MNRQPLVLICMVLLFMSCIAKNHCVLKDEGNAFEEIMFTSNRDGNFEVYLMNSDSSKVKRLTNNGKTDYGLGWSPDGEQILFYSNRAGNEDIRRMKKDGTELLNLTNSPSRERAAAYSPDNKTIAFISDRANNATELFLMNADGSNVRQLTNHQAYCESIAWSKDGKQIIFTMEVKNDSLINNFSGEIFSMLTDGSNLKRLTYREGFDSVAAVSPNGKSIVFYGKSESGKYDLFSMDMDGSNLLNLTNDDVEDYSPSFSADGNWISFTSGSAANYDVYKMNLKSREKLRLTTILSRDETPYYNPAKY